jgi:hypothetical protein
MILTSILLPLPWMPLPSWFTFGCPYSAPGSGAEYVFNMQSYSYSAVPYFIWPGIMAQEMAPKMLEIAGFQ